MKKSLPIMATGCLLFFASFFCISCNKDSTASIASTSSSDEIAVASADSTNGKDTTYIIHQCGAGYSRDSIAASALPAAVTDYLQENYSGYTFGKAYSVSDADGNLSGYVVIIYVDEKPTGIEFDSEGAFVRVLEKRSGRHGSHR